MAIGHYETQKKDPAHIERGLMLVLKLDRSGYFTGTQAPGTNIYMARRAVDHCLHALDIGLPGTIGTPVGVRDLNTEGHALVAKFALSHPLHLLAVCDLLRCFRKHLIV